MKKVITILGRDVVDNFLSDDPKKHHEAEKLLKVSLDAARSGADNRKGTLVICDDEKQEPQKMTIENDFLVVRDGNRYIDGVQHYSSGTDVITIKTEKPE